MLDKHEYIRHYGVKGMKWKFSKADSPTQGGGAEDMTEQEMLDTMWEDTATTRYDDNHNVISKERYAKDGRLLSSEKYDKSGNVKSVTNYKIGGDTKLSRISQDKINKAKLAVDNLITSILRK